MNSFDLDGVHYEYYDISEILSDASILPVFHKYRKSGYVDIGCAFDIETTSYYSEKHDSNLASMYNWQMALDNLVIMGSHWEDFKKLIEILDKKCKKAKAKLMILDQNLSFEFSFIKGILPWKINKKTGKCEIFAKDERTVLYAKTGHIEFRDTLALTGIGLDKYQKNFNLDVGKLKGDLDYSVMRFTSGSGTTPMTDREKAYCINDVFVLTDFYHKFLKPQFLDQDKPIPLTSTGIPRSEVKDAFKEMSKEDQRKMRNEIRNAMPNRDVYNLWRRFLFRGGFTHANVIACNELVEKPFKSYDAKSMHPSQCFHHNFSYKYVRRNPERFLDILEDSRDEQYGFFGLFIFYNIQSASFHSLESKNKLVEYSDDAIFDNGRLCRAKKITVMLNQIDFKNYELMYKFDSYEVVYIYQSYMKPLPDYLLKTMAHYFWLKENCGDDVVLRNLTKRKLNGCFGMCATGLTEIDLEFDPITQEFQPSKELKTYDELVKNLILLPQWAIEIAAYSRAQLCDAIMNGGGVDSIYYDTDSNKVNHPELHSKYYDDFNEKMIAFNRTINTFGYDKKPFEKLGCWELEYVGTRYKVLGAKRYLVEHDGQIQCTVAGMVKGTLEHYCEENNLNIWDEFSDDLYLSPEYSKKKTTVYHDEPFEDDVIDCNGVEHHISEKSCVAIISIPFHMSVESYFLNLITLRKQERERDVYKGVQ